MAIFNVSAGHNPDGKIACGAVGLLRESTENRNVLRWVKYYLKKEGHTVYDCTCNDGKNALDVLKKIVKKCNKHSNVTLDVSIHFNSGAKDQKGNKATTGVEVLVYSIDGKAYKYADRICKKVAALGYKNRGVKVRKDLYVLKNTKAPALLVECCFVDDKDDCKLYNAEKMGKAIAEGILGKTIKTTTTIKKKYTLLLTPIYASATTKTISSRKTGIYYAWSNEIVNGRIRITNSVKNIGKAGQVTGWMNVKQ